MHLLIAGPPPCAVSSVGAQCADQTARQKSLFPSVPRASRAGADQPRCSVWAEEDRALFGPRTRTRTEGKYLLVSTSRALFCKSVG
jgi:hypothetical protein